MRTPHLKIGSASPLFIWGIGLFSHAVWYVHAALSGSPSDEIYANTIPFQLVAFWFHWLPAWSAGFVAIILCKLIMNRHHNR